MNRRLLIALLAATLHAQTKPTASDACTRAGAVFSIDPLTNGLLIKDSTGYIAHFDVGKQTKIVKLSVSAAGSDQGQPMEPAQIQPGDLVCVQAAGEGSAASGVTVVSRTDVERAQREFVAAWQRDSAFGSISALQADKMTIKTPAGQTVEILLGDTTVYRNFPTTAKQVSDARQVKRTDLHVGDSVFVRGRRSSQNSGLEATAVTGGGVRAIIGTFIDTHPLDSTVTLREYGTKTDLIVRVPALAIYRTVAQLNHPSRIVGPNDVNLVPLGFSDLQAGDIVLVIGRSNASAKAEGLALVTRFGYFGTAPAGDKQQVEWMLK